MEDLARHTLAVAPSLVLLGLLGDRGSDPRLARGVWPTFVLGMALFVPMLALEGPLRAAIAPIGDPLARRIADAFVLAAIPEELLKAAVLVGFAWRRIGFRDRQDAIVLGAAASLGFATIENVLYVAAGGLETAVLRAMTAVPCHAILGVLLGACVARAVRERRSSVRRAVAWTVAIAAPVALHGAYDASLFVLSGLVGGTLVVPWDSLLLLSMAFALFTTSLGGGVVLAFAVALGASRARRRERSIRAIRATGRAAACEAPRVASPRALGPDFGRVGGVFAAGIGGWGLAGLARGVDVGSGASGVAAAILALAGTALLFGTGLFWASRGRWRAPDRRRRMGAPGVLDQS